MTSSFNTVLGTQRDAAPDISKWNYAVTEPDLVKSVNDEIDATSKTIQDHFALLVDQENQYAKNKQLAHKQLMDLIPRTFPLIVKERDRRAALVLQKDWIDLDNLKDKYNSRERKKNPKHPEVIKINKIEDDQKKEAEIFNNDEKILQEGTAQVLTAETNAYKAKDHYAAKFLEGFGDQDRHERVELTQAYDVSPEFLEYASSTLETQMPDGSWKTLNQVKNLNEYRIAYGGIMSLWVSSVISKRDYSPRLVRQLLIKPLFQDYQTAKKAYIAKNVEARKVTISEEKSKALIEQVKGQFATGGADNPESLSDEQVKENAKKMGSVITEYIKNYHGFHEFSWLQSRGELFQYLEDAYVADQLSDAQVEAIGNAIIKGHDGGFHKLKEYWAKDYQSLKSKLQTKKRERFQAKVLDDRIAMRESDDRYEEEYMSEGFLNLTPDEQEEKIKTWQKETLRTLGRPSSYLNGLLTHAEEADLDWEKARLEDLRYKKEVLGLRIDPSELRKFDRDGPIYPLVEELVDKKSMTPGEIANANEFVRGETNSYTKEKVAKTETGSPFWIAVRQQADAAFRRYYSDFINKPGTTKDGAYDHAIRQVRKDMKEGLYDQYPVVNPDQELSLNIAKAQRLVGQNPTLIDSTEPWEGEEVHLRAALSYLGYGKLHKGMVDPTVYYAPLLTGFGKDKSVSDLMEDRLIATGLIKDRRVNPEKLINLDERILLNHKSSPARTYRSFFQNPDDKEGLLEYTDFKTLAQLSSATRANAQISNSYTTPGLDWIQQVNIEPELINAYSDIIGETPFFMHLDNLLPGVAEEQVKRTLIEPKEPFDMATLGQPETAGESFQKTGIAQTIVGTRDLVRSALTDEAGNPNATGRVIKRIISGEGVRDIETWIETAPIGKIISILDGILDGPTMEEISKSNE